MTTRALIFANGAPNDGPLVRRTLAEARDAIVYAADGGLHNAQYYDIAVHTLIGDMDSLEADEVAAQAARGVEIERHPVHKNETDLELVLIRAAERGATWIRILGGVGDRLDQTLSNVYLMALPALVGRDVRLVAGKQETRLLSPGEWTLEGAAGDTVSLMPLNGVARGVETEGLYYPLHNEDLLFGPARGVSNVMDGPQARICLREGCLLLVYTLGHA